MGRLGGGRSGPPSTFGEWLETLSGAMRVCGSACAETSNSGWQSYAMATVLQAASMRCYSLRFVCAVLVFDTCCRKRLRLRSGHTDMAQSGSTCRNSTSLRSWFKVYSELCFFGLIAVCAASGKPTINPLSWVGLDSGHVTIEKKVTCESAKSNTRNATVFVAQKCVFSRLTGTQYSVLRRGTLDSGCACCDSEIKAESRHLSYKVS
eukprot:3765772-Rhodomonas_salina.2